MDKTVLTATPGLKLGGMTSSLRKGPFYCLVTCLALRCSLQFHCFKSLIFHMSLKNLMFVKPCKIYKSYWLLFKKKTSSAQIKLTHCRLTQCVAEAKPVFWVPFMKWPLFSDFLLGFPKLHHFFYLGFLKTQLSLNKHRNKFKTTLTHSIRL